MKLNAKELRDLEEKRATGKIRMVKRNPIYFILENIYDTYNIGGLFRLGDALAIEKIYLCGETEIPPNSRIKKASIGTYKVVDWEYKKSVKDAVSDLKSRLNDLQVVAVEQSKKATDYRNVDYSLPIAFIFGNETYGVLPETLELADKIVEIPMWGINKSLNVIVSAAIVSYFVTSRL